MFCLKLSTEIMQGLLTSTMMIPVMLSFTSIIFRDQVFADYMPLLIKLVLCSAFVHQIAMLCFSSLPFAVGQVQDAGLVFLSTMATNIATSMKDSPTDNMMATVVVVLAASTFLLGVVFFAVGRFQVAQAVQYFPMPVLGAFLAYIGFFRYNSQNYNTSNLCFLYCILLYDFVSYIKNIN